MILQFLTQTGTSLTKKGDANNRYTGSTGLNWAVQGKPGWMTSLETQPRTMDASVWALRIYLFL